MKWIIALLSLALTACGLTGPVAGPTKEALVTSTEVAQAMSLPTETTNAQPATSTPPDASLPPGTPAPFPKDIQKLSMIDQSNGWAADAANRLFRTADGDESWYSMPVPGSYIAGLSAFLDTTHAWLADPQRGLWRTTDGGLTWTHLTDIGLPTEGADPFYQFISPDDGLVEVSGFGKGKMYDRVFETHDGGASFHVIPVVGPTNEMGLAEGVVQYCRLCGNALYYNSSHTIIVEGGLEKPPGTVRMRQSTDLGQHWSESTLALPSGYEDALVVALPLAFQSDGRGYLPVRLLKYNANGKAYDAVAIYTTSDDGATWSQPTMVLSNAEPFMLNFNDLDVEVLCGGDLCISHDGAQTWETITPNVDFSHTDTHYVQEMTFPTPLNGWILMWESPAIYKLYRTDNGGATWTLLNH
jgi:photosystem II stability/assembly factor-like uncharacterized protein/predicted small lipoprotein YifL